MSADDRFERALGSEDPVTRLRSLAESLLVEGLEPSDLVARFEAVRRELREADREQDEDAVMDVMDFLVGWCSPEADLSTVARLVVEENTPTNFDVVPKNPLGPGLQIPLETKRI